MLKNSTLKYSDVELLGILRKESEKLGRTPTVKDFSKYKGVPSFNTYTARFGSWGSAIKKAGLEPAAKVNKERKRSEIINTIKELHNKTGSLPTVNEISKIIPGRTISRHFGSWNNAVNAAGLKPRAKKKSIYLSDDELLDVIKDFYEMHGRIPKKKRL